MKNCTITFESEARKELLSLLGKSVDDDGYITEKSDRAQRVPSTDGTPLRIKNFAGVRKGSEIYIKSDFNSLIDLSELI